MSSTARIPPRLSPTPAPGQNTEHHAMALALRDLRGEDGFDNALDAARLMTFLLRHGFDVMPTDPARLDSRIKGYLDRIGAPRPPSGSGGGA